MPYCSNCGSAELEGQQFCATCGTPTLVSTLGAAPLPYFPMDVPDKAPLDHLAGFWWRVLGYFIDNVILLIVVELPLDAGHVAFYPSVSIRVLCFFLYGTIFLARGHGRTPGMMVVGIHVESLNERTLTFARAALRTFVYVALATAGSFYHQQHFAHATPQQAQIVTHQSVVFFAISIPGLIDLLWMLWDKKNQTLHDKVAGTVVLRTVNQLL